MHWQGPRTFGHCPCQWAECQPALIEVCVVECQLPFPPRLSFKLPGCCSIRAAPSGPLHPSVSVGGPGYALLCLAFN